MLTSVACSCVRNGRKVSVPVAKLSLFSTVKKSTRTLSVTGVHDLSRHRLPGLLTPTPWQLLSARSVSLSAASHGGADPLGSPSTPAESDPPDRENFGSLSTDMSSRRSFKKMSPYIQDLQYREEDDNGGEEPVRLRRRPGTRNTPYWYFLQCKRLIKENNLQEALDVFSRDMLQGERLQPEEFNYTVLIGGCGRAGQLKRAFRLYNDEMLQNGHVVTRETFHYLLMGCLKNKETGFRLALQVWRQMLRSGITPDSNDYNLLLRTARDCGIGDVALTTGVLLQPGQKYERDRASRVKSESGCKDVVDIDLLERQLFIQPDPRSASQRDSRDGEEEPYSRQESTHLVPVRQTETITLPVDLASESAAPNLLDIFEGKSSGVVSLGTVDGPTDRLALIGGAEGFLEKMAANKLSPDLKTMTLLADTMEPSHQSLQMLLKVAKQHKVKLDVAFFNSVIRKAAKAGDLEEAKSVLSVMRQRNVNVDAQTFGSLAFGCEQQQDGLQLLTDMEEAGFKPNIQVFSALIGRATRRLDYVYLKTLLKSMRSMGVWPNEVIIRQLEFASQYPPNYNKYKSRNKYLDQIDGFRGYYQHWLRDMPAQGAEDDQAGLQSEADAAVLKTEAEDGLTENQRNQRAAARRYNSRKKDKTSSAAL
ncbi:hypothetical protein ABVT39_018485 [Epinephelus coioides]